MSPIRFACDADRCIACNGCVAACNDVHEAAWVGNRRRIVTLDAGEPGERSISVACMHCANAACIVVCPVDAIERTADGVVRVDKDRCIGCGYCAHACPFGAPQFATHGAHGRRSKMDKCTACAGGPTGGGTSDDLAVYGPNRLAAGRMPVCVERCTSQALLGGDGDAVVGAFRRRVGTRGKGGVLWGWTAAYGRPAAVDDAG